MRYARTQRVSQIASIAISAFGAFLFFAILGGFISFNDPNTQIAAPVEADNSVNE